MHFYVDTIRPELYHMETLPAHHREKGEHYDKTFGPDFALAQNVALVKYGWDGFRAARSMNA